MSLKKMCCHSWKKPRLKMVWILMSNCCRINEMCTYNCKFQYFSYNFNEFSNICKNYNAIELVHSAYYAQNHRTLKQVILWWKLCQIKNSLEFNICLSSTLIVNLSLEFPLDNIECIACMRSYLGGIWNHQKRERFCLQHVFITHVLVDRVVVEYSLHFHWKWNTFTCMSPNTRSLIHTIDLKQHTNKHEYTRSVG